MQVVEHQIEDLEQRDFAHVASSRRRQCGSDVGFKLLVRYTGRDSAHVGTTFAEVYSCMMHYLFFFSKV